MVTKHPLTKKELERAYEMAIADNDQWEKEEEERIKKKKKRKEKIWAHITTWYAFSPVAGSVYYMITASSPEQISHGGAVMALGLAIGGATWMWNDLMGRY